MKIKVLQFLLILIFTFSFHSCGIYSFTGASIDPTITSINIGYFNNKAQLVQPTLSQVFTNALKDRFVAQTRLTLTNEFADMYLEGFISDYRISPVAIQAGETAAMNRLTINVNVKFTNSVDPKQNFETTFSAYEDFPRSSDLSAVEIQLIEQISAYLVDDIFNKAVVNW
ncbi:MAG: LptE family protein [Bacteroidales bacterium]|jgi:hypothetical protein|nr:LptE family protein [Bacteroidales bacterium]